MFKGISGDILIRAPLCREELASKFFVMYARFLYKFQAESICINQAFIIKGFRQEKLTSTVGETRISRPNGGPTKGSPFNPSKR